MSLLLELFLTFFRIGLFTFGGGYAMLSIIEENCVEQKQWITHDEMMNITVIAESTPGPIAINCATYVGQRQAGIKGALAATFGVVLPSFIIIYAVSMFFDSILEVPLIANAFRGIKVGVSFLILGAALRMIRKMDKDAFSRVILACAFAAMLCINLFALRFSSIALMLIAGCAGLCAHAVLRARGGVKR